MSLTRRLARPLLASIFVYGGYGALREPGGRSKLAEPVALPIAERVPGLPADADTLVRINAGVQLGAGLLLATGRLRRPAALALLASIVPTTLAGHRFWESNDDGDRAQQTIHFLKNLGLAGGLLLAAVDADGAPSLGWRARRRAEIAGTALHAGREGAEALLARTAAALPVG